MDQQNGNGTNSTLGHSIDHDVMISLNFKWIGLTGFGEVFLSFKHFGQTVILSAITEEAMSRLKFLAEPTGIDQMLQSEDGGRQFPME